MESFWRKYVTGRQASSSLPSLFHVCVRGYDLTASCPATCCHVYPIIWTPPSGSPIMPCLSPISQNKPFYKSLLVLVFCHSNQKYLYTIGFDLIFCFLIVFNGHMIIHIVWCFDACICCTIIKIFNVVIIWYIYHFSVIRTLINLSSSTVEIVSVVSLPYNNITTYARYLTRTLYQALNFQLHITLFNSCSPWEYIWIPLKWDQWDLSFYADCLTCLLDSRRILSSQG